MSLLYPDLSHLKETDRTEYLDSIYNRSPRQCPHHSSGSDSEDDAHGPLPKGHRRCRKCYPCQWRLCEGLVAAQRQLGFLSHERNDSDAGIHGRGRIHFGRGFLCEADGCEGPFSSEYCGRCRPDIERIYGPQPHENEGSSCAVEGCHGPFSPTYCGHCRPDREGIYSPRPHSSKGSSCGVEECGGPFSSKYCGHCQPDTQEIHGPKPNIRKGSSCEVEECQGPFSSSYCGRCWRAHEGSHGNRDDDVTPRYRYEAGGSSDGSDLGYRYEIEDEEFPRGRNHVMERENIAKGPHWWSRDTHNEHPAHHSGLYSWVHCSGGDVPHNAVKVGRDEDGGRTYVGRAWHECDLLPAKVAPSHGGAFVPWGGLEHSKIDYEVLASDSSRVAWQEASRGNVPPHALVAGHTSSGEALYVGRTLHHGIMAAGKVQHSHGTLYIAWAGREIHYDEYEVLVVVD